MRNSQIYNQPFLLHKTVSTLYRYPMHFLYTKNRHSFSVCRTFCRRCTIFCFLYVFLYVILVKINQKCTFSVDCFPQFSSTANHFHNRFHTRCAISTRFNITKKQYRFCVFWGMLGLKFTSYTSLLKNGAKKTSDFTPIKAQNPMFLNSFYRIINQHNFIKNHLVIFSCLTLWSITCLDASSR